MNRVQLTAVQRGLMFLQAQQQTDGSFLSFSSPRAYNFQNDFTYKTTFANAVILRCLSEIDAPNIDTVRQPLLAYLQSQIHDDGAFNYWDRNSMEYKTIPYPNDLDDTFCAYGALAAYAESCIDGSRLAQITIMLMQAETQPGGPYYTWLSSLTDPAWKDVDVVVNANILFFLQQKGIHQPQLKLYMAEVIRTRQYYSPYYPSPYHTLYFFSKIAEKTSYDDMVLYVDKLLKIEQPRQTIELAMLTIALEIVGKSKLAHMYRTQLVDLQASDDSWPATAFCIDPKRNGQKYFNGSPSLSTAFALEALVFRKEKTKPKMTDKTQPLIQKTISTTKIQLLDTDIALQTSISAQIQHIAAGKHANEIIASPYLFYKSLPKTSNTLPHNFLESLSAANTFGWIAYSIYDDFMDEEGLPALLPIANVAHRKSLINFFQAIQYKHGFQGYIIKTFNTIDAANNWELQHCRYPIIDDSLELGTLPNFGNRYKLAEKSIGHILPFLLVSLYKGMGIDDREFAILEDALINYLIARQMHDDAHDWQKDLSKGHISYVATTLLTQSNVPRGSHVVSDLIAKAQNTYWRQTLPSICTTIGEHLTASRSALESIGYGNTSLISLVERLEKATQKTIHQQKDTVLFLDTYQALTQNRN